MESLTAKKDKEAPKEIKPKAEPQHPHQEKIKFEQKPENASLLVTAELNNDCKAKVTRISKECRAINRKFRCAEIDAYCALSLTTVIARDIEFDLEDAFRVLIGSRLVMSTILRMCDDSESRKSSITPNSSLTDAIKRPRQPRRLLVPLRLGDDVHGTGLGGEILRRCTLFPCLFVLQCLSHRRDRDVSKLACTDSSSSAIPLGSPLSSMSMFQP